MNDKLLIAYYKGELSDKEAQQVTEWIETDEGNQRYYQRLCRLFEMSYWIEDESELIKVSLYSDSKILPWKRYIISFMKIAAIFMLGFVIHLFLSRQNTIQDE